MDNIMNRLALPVLAIGLVAVGGFAAVGHPFQPDTTAFASPQAQVTDNVEYEGYNVEVALNGETLVEKHNVLMEGENMTRNALKGDVSYDINDIAVGNGTAPTDTSESLDSEWASCGLSTAQATNETNIDSGPDDEAGFELSYTYDVTCNDVIVNTTALLDAQTADDDNYFAGVDLGRDINPFSGDDLTITWTNTVDDN